MLLIAAAGFLLGGAYSLAKLDGDCRRGRRRGQLAVAAVLLLAAVYLGIAGILQVSAE